MKEELKKYIQKNLEVEKKFLAKSCYSFARSAFEEDTAINYDDSNINQFIESNHDNSNFQTILFNYIDERNLKDSDVYNKVHLDRRLFSKIRNDKEYHPSKETVLLLGISLELNEKEILKLLESASYSLPKNNYYDLIMRFCFINKVYNINKINDLLEEYHCKLLSV